MATRTETWNREQHDLEELTGLLNAWSEGDRESLERLVPLVYGELKALARSQLRKERLQRTLQTTELVHEAFLRLSQHPVSHWKGRRHFYVIAARMMRWLLVDEARRRSAAKRGGPDRPTSLEEIPELGAARDEDLVAMDQALSELASIDPLKAWIVELRFFGGFSIEETGEIVNRSRATVIRHWRVARAWLYQCLRGDGPPEKERQQGDGRAT